MHTSSYLNLVCPLNTFLAKALTIVATLAISGCAAPNSQFATLSPEQAERNRQYTERIEAVGRAQEREERMGRAEAAEVATRNAPKNVSTTTVYAPRF
jgi:hypothetical protein